MAATTTIYLLHFDRPFGHAKHYLGSTAKLDERLAAHANGNGARLLYWVRAAGIGWTLARTWSGGRARERQLKKRGGHGRLCPICLAGMVELPGSDAAVVSAGPARLADERALEVAGGAVAVGYSVSSESAGFTSAAG